MAQDTQTLENLDYQNPTASDQSPTLPDKEEKKESHDPSSLYLLPFLILKYLNKARFLEEDSEYIKISEKVKTDYLRDRALGKKAVGLKEDVLTEEDLEYIYGQATHLDFPTLNKDAEKIFTQGLDEKNEKKRAKLVEKRKKKLEKYEKEKSKIYKNPDHDPLISHLYGTIKTHASLKYLYLTKVKKQKNVEYSKIRDEIKTKAWIGFISRYPKKAIEYRNRKYAKAKCYKDLIQAYIQTWNTSQQSSRVNSNIANRQADEIVKKELEKQKEEQASTSSQQTSKTKLSTKIINKINDRFASRLMRQPLVPPSDAMPQYAPESPPMTESMPSGSVPEQSQRPSTSRNQRTNPLRQRANNMAGDAAKKFGKKIAKQALKKIATSALTNPYVLAALGIILIILLIIVTIIVIITGGPKENEKPKVIPGLTLEMSGPSSVENGNNISYTIRISYSGIGEIIIYDQIPENTSFVSATGNYKNESNTISWALKENTPISPKINPLKVYSFDLIIHPEKRDIIVINKPTAKLIGYPMPDSTDFDKLMRDQGRNIGVLGSEDNFTTSVMTNGITARFPLLGKDNFVRKVYRTAVSKNVNPLAVMATWGTEAFFGLNDLEFGCDPYGKKFPGFDNQVSCGANTWNNWINYFEQNKKPDGTLGMASNIGKTCIYDDGFLYAAEKYGPICTIYDSNDFFRKNFVKYYRAFAGM